MLTRIIRRGGGRAAGGIAGQVSQAAASLFLQLAAARTLGASGLGTFAILFGAVVLGTAVSSGLIGDSLTVLDRHNAHVRSGLVWWCLVVAFAAGGLAATVIGASGLLSWSQSALFGCAAAVFIIEDAFRRLLMANQRFWSLTIVDGTGLLGALLVIAAVVVSGRSPSVGTFMLALLVGQTVATIAAWLRLPARERWLPLRSARGGMRTVFSYGAWRSVQLGIRPAVLVTFRLLITAATGVAIYGQVEAARIYMAPALIVVSGIGAVLLPGYASRSETSTRLLLRRGDRAAAALLGVTAGMGLIAWALLPWGGPLITAGAYSLSAVSVLAWATVAVASAVSTPYNTLAAVRVRRQGLFTLVRFLDPLVGLVVLVPMVLWVRIDAAPLALALGAMTSALVVRFGVLRGVVNSETRSPPTAVLR